MNQLVKNTWADLGAPTMTVMFSTEIRQYACYGNVKGNVKGLS
jgi:hypothetical protein